MTQCVDLPQPLAPGRKWSRHWLATGGFRYFLQDETGNGVCTLRQPDNNSGLWAVWIHDRPVWIHDRPAWMTGRTIVDLGPHDEPPFEIAEAMADAVR